MKHPVDSHSVYLQSNRNFALQCVSIMEFMYSHRLVAFEFIFVSQCVVMQLFQYIHVALFFFVHSFGSAYWKKVVAVFFKGITWNHLIQNIFSIGCFFEIFQLQWTTVCRSLRYFDAETHFSDNIFCLSHFREGSRLIRIARIIKLSIWCPRKEFTFFYPSYVRSLQTSESKETENFVLNIAFFFSIRLRHKKNHLLIDVTHCDKPAFLWFDFCASISEPLAFFKWLLR